VGDEVVDPNDIDPSVIPDGVEMLLLAHFGNRASKNCGDCGAVPGAKHTDGCDVERCTACMGQRLQCSPDECLAKGDVCDHCGQHGVKDNGCFTNAGECKSHDKNKARWTGYWPGALECIRLKFFCYEDPSRSTGEYWVQCDQDHPKARPDLNRLAVHQQKERRASSS
jgi:hypothetical protein